MTSRFVGPVLAILPILMTSGKGWAADAGGIQPMATGAPTVTILDDGEKIAREVTRPLPPSAWPSPEDVSLFAMRDEIVAFQVVVEGADVEIPHLHGELSALALDGGATLALGVSMFREHFVEITRPSGNDREPGALAFTETAAPPPLGYTGWIADALIPGEATVAAHQRGALWFDLAVPRDATPGVYHGVLTVSSGETVVAQRGLTFRVIDRALPYGATRVMALYDPDTLTKRMGDASSERGLRWLMHAHGVNAFRQITNPDPSAPPASTATEAVEATGATAGGPEGTALDYAAASGSLFTREAGYVGPGEGAGDGVFVVGAYGALGDPDPEKAARVAEFAKHLRENGSFEATHVFIYAVDEKCKSSRPGAWLDLLRNTSGASGVRVGVTCGEDPLRQRADLVMITAEDYDVALAEKARALGKWVWAYNGRRPFAGPMMLDVPATDLRANAWIATRFGIPRWFYWETTYWLDDGRGGKGGAKGFDPFVTAETFHNRDGDYDNGDGILVYPGTQKWGMHDEKVNAVFPSIRLKNLRRGVQDAGYIQLARAVNPEATERVIERMIPEALKFADDRVAWPERGVDWLRAREDLVHILDGEAFRVPPPPPRPRHLHLRRWLPRSATARGLLALAGVVLCGSLIAFARIRRRNRGVTPRRRGALRER